MADPVNTAVNTGDATLLVEATAGVDLNGDGDLLDTITTDANGGARVVGTDVDLGAVEVQATIGSSGGDTLNGTAGDDAFVTGAGTDVVVAGDGNDSVDGGSGPDAMALGTGEDTGVGGSGDDLIFGGPGGDLIYGVRTRTTID